MYHTQQCRCPSGDGKTKTLYQTEGEALVRADKQPMPLRTYRCPDADGFHLTCNIGGYHG